MADDHGCQKETAAEFADGMKAGASRVAADLQQKAAQQIDRVVGEIHSRAAELDESDPNLAWLARQAADRADAVRAYVAEANVARLRADARNFARDHPVLFFGGLFAAGLLLGNVSQARTPARPRGDEPDETLS